MTINDVLRRLRFAFSLDDAGTARMCSAGGVDVTEEQVRGLTAKEGPEDWCETPPEVLQAFLDGLILAHRGPPPKGKSPPPKTELTTNSVLRSVRIALTLKDVDMLRMLEAAGMTMSKTEFSAFFRRPDHKHFRACGHQVLRKFLRGLTLELRPESKQNTKARVQTS